jgi:hypothetical protein
MAFISKNMSIVIDGSILGCATDFSLSVDKNFIEVACLESLSTQQIPDMYAWTLSFSGFVPVQKSEGAGKKSYYDLMDNLIAATDTSVGVYILPDASSQSYYTGQGWIQNVTMDGGVGSAVTYSGEILGNGGLTKSTTA